MKLHSGLILKNPDRYNIQSFKNIFCMSLEFLVISTECLSELNRKTVWVHVRNYKSNYLQDYTIIGKHKQ